MYQELRGKKGVTFCVNSCSLSDFVRALANTLIIKAPEVRFAQLCYLIISDEIMNEFDNGEKVYI